MSVAFMLDTAEKAFIDQSIAGPPISLLWGNVGANDSSFRNTSRSEPASPSHPPRRAKRRQLRATRLAVKCSRP